MLRPILFVLFAIVAPLALDYYVYRNWRRFVAYRQQARKPAWAWTLPLYRVLMVVMPLTLPVYFYFSNWWTVEPKLARAAFFTFWAVYYVPKALIALVLLLKDLGRFVYWLFDWYQDRLLYEQPNGTTDKAAAHDLDLSDMKRTSRRDFLAKMGWSAAAVPYVLVGYSAFRTLYDFEVHRVEVPLPGLPRQFEGLTIAQLSDLHAGSFFSTRPIEEAVGIVQSLQPDLITITGDYVNHDVRELPVILPSLNRLSADLGVYGCLGNHDHYARVGELTRQVRATSVDLLVNEHRTLGVDGARLHLIGVDNTGFNQHHADLPGATKGLIADPGGEETRILLAHTPTFWDEEVRPRHPEIDLMLAGHTHGGQIGLELGPLRMSLARVAYARWAGLYAEPAATQAGSESSRQQLLYVNRGLGTVGPPLRLGIRPEITLLTLRRA